MRMVTLWRADHLDERLALASELEQLCVKYGRPQATLLVAYAGNQAAMEAGDFATADRRLATIDETAAALRQPLALGYARLRQSMRAAVDGRLAESERLADEAYEYARTSGQPDASAFWVGHRFNIRFHQGRLTETAEELAGSGRGVPRDRRLPRRESDGGWPTSIDSMRLARLSTPSSAPGGTGVPDDLNWLTTIAFATHAAAGTGDRSRCAELVGALTPYRQQFVDNGTTFNGSVERYIGLALSCLERHSEAAASFARAADANARLDAPILSARTFLEWAEATVRADVDGSAPDVRPREVRRGRRHRRSTLADDDRPALPVADSHRRDMSNPHATCPDCSSCGISNAQSLHAEQGVETDGQAREFGDPLAGE